MQKHQDNKSKDHLKTKVYYVTKKGGKEDNIEEVLRVALLSQSWFTNSSFGKSKV
jgi:hypothetical protein